MARNHLPPSIFGADVLRGMSGIVGGCRASSGAGKRVEGSGSYKGWGDSKLDTWHVR